MIVNRIIESPGHGKVVIDGINFDEKRCLVGKICMISTPEADNSKQRMNTNSMVGNISCSLAKECKRLCDDEERINNVKSYIKSKKREGNTKIKKVYHNSREMMIMQ